MHWREIQWTLYRFSIFLWSHSWTWSLSHPVPFFFLFENRIKKTQFENFKSPFLISKNRGRRFLEFSRNREYLRIITIIRTPYFWRTLFNNIFGDVLFLKNDFFILSSFLSYVSWSAIPYSSLCEQEVHIIMNSVTFFSAGKHVQVN